MFVKAAKKLVKEWFGDDPKKSEDLGRIVSDRHFDRIMKMVETTKATKALGNNLLTFQAFFLIFGFFERLSRLLVTTCGL